MEACADCGIEAILQIINSLLSSEWRHNGLGSVSNGQPPNCLLNRLFKRRSKKTSKLRVTGLYAGNPPGTGEFPAQRVSNAENVSIWWRHHECRYVISHCIFPLICFICIAVLVLNIFENRSFNLATCLAVSLVSLGKPEGSQHPLLLTWINFNPSMDK